MMETVSRADLYATHQVENQPPVLTDYNLFESDAALRQGLSREGAGAEVERAREFGGYLGSAQVIELGVQANRNLPELRTHDRQGNRLDEVVFHPSYHELMRIGIEAQVHALPWNRPGPGAHVVRAAFHYMLSQIEAGVGCPLTMTFAAVPALRHQEDVASEWVPRITSTSYDPRFVPVTEKKGATMGMFMTEKQGGSDVRANSTEARAIGVGGPGGEYELTGHKWFCSAPMCDAFLTLAQTDVGLSCFLVPRWLADGTKNRLYLQRLKDKLGNRSNASSEIELVDTWGVMIGEEGRGVATIIDMVAHTRLDCLIGASALMRQGTVQAMHHTRHRSAFGKKLNQQPLMKNVLADLAIESEAATVLMLRLARAYDEAELSPEQRAFARIATPVAKYWVCRRAPRHVFEAMECHGGGGYVEDSIMPRLYREAPVNSIWEGSGNVICLDVLRCLKKEPDTLGVFVREVREGKGVNRWLDMAMAELEMELTGTIDVEIRARRIVEKMATVLQASLLVRSGHPAVADAFCTSRLGEDTGGEFGTLPPGVDFDTIIERATVHNT